MRRPKPLPLRPQATISLRSGTDGETRRWLQLWPHGDVLGQETRWGGQHTKLRRFSFFLNQALRLMSSSNLVALLPVFFNNAARILVNSLVTSFSAGVLQE